MNVKKSRLLPLLILVSVPGTMPLAQPVRGQAPSPAAASPQNETDLQRGIALYKEGEYFEAVSHLLEALKKDGRNVEAMIYLGLTYGKLNNQEEALEMLRKAQKLAPNSDKVHCGLADAYLAIGSPKDALKAATTAVGINPKSHEALYFQSLSNLRLGNYATARDGAIRSNALKPDDEFILQLVIQATYLHYGRSFFEFGEKYDKPTPDQKRAALRERLGWLETALTAVENFLTANRRNKTQWTREAATIREFIGFEQQSEPDNPDYTPNGPSTRPRLLRIPSPKTTPEAQNQGVTGKVVVLVLVSEQGKATYVIPIKTLPFGLTEEALRVASEAEFSPATRSGKPVRYLARLEVNFNVPLNQ